MKYLIRFYHTIRLSDYKASTFLKFCGPLLSDHPTIAQSTVFFKYFYTDWKHFTVRESIQDGFERVFMLATCNEKSFVNKYYYSDLLVIRKTDSYLHYFDKKDQQKKFSNSFFLLALFSDYNSLHIIWRYG